MTAEITNVDLGRYFIIDNLFKICYNNIKEIYLSTCSQCLRIRKIDPKDTGMAIVIAMPVSFYKRLLFLRKG